jgi:UDP-N-acetylmuramate--alanine ligase
MNRVEPLYAVKIHIIGIGGTGMNGIAQLAACPAKGLGAHAGYQVSGSDRATGLPIFQALKNLGIEIFPQDGSGITADTDFVVYSTAIESDNPDIQKAKALNIPLLHRADMLAKLCEGKEVIAVAGTAGKSTVTGLLGWIFQCLELDPTVYCGAPVLNWKDNVAEASSLCNQRQGCRCHTVGNVRFGTGPWIIEADESDKSFLKFHPKYAIITNIAEDHFSLAELHQLFAQFKSQVTGIVIEPHEGSVLYFNDSQLKTLNYRTDPSCDSSNVIHGSRDGCDTVPQAFAGVIVRAPALLGRHNEENITNALRLCKALGLDMQKCIEAVGSFKGIERRLERHGPKVIDDFAHSPVKIAAALEAVSGEFPAFSVYWRPHGYTPLFQGLDGFVEVFRNACTPREGTRPTANCRPGDPTGRLKKLFILPVYFAGGTVNIKVTSEQFVERLRASGVPAEFVQDYDTLEKRLIEKGLPVLGMGARDPELPLFAERISAKIH